MAPIVLITGISGSGKSVALKQLEDLGYNCVDNLPLRLLSEFIVSIQDENLEKVAVAIDARSHGDIAKLGSVIENVQNMGVALEILFLEANDQTLFHRYSESRRRHPLTQRLEHQLGTSPSLEECIAYERNLMGYLRQMGHVIDTSNLSPIKLRSWVKDVVQAERGSLLLTLESFAFKKGVPSSADLVFDVRCLPNPHYVSDLRPLTGCDQAIGDWLQQQNHVEELITDIEHFIKKWLPVYMQDTRSYLTVAIGCTGGQHRSVYVTEQLAQRLSDHKPLRIRHRALNL
ncbi:RNase adapter RapZ [Brackiella oedipodis]|uniref:RNase adapter RapZ n=1 Tax=Brackiella oedipodis TaxID=124225 RepID=UPI00048AD826|nr:RNase adapter RapZ [Brackiella oedipodis]